MIKLAEKSEKPQGRPTWPNNVPPHIQVERREPLDEAGWRAIKSVTVSLENNGNLIEGLIVAVSDDGKQCRVCYVDKQQHAFMMALPFHEKLPEQKKSTEGTLKRTRAIVGAALMGVVAMGTSIGLVNTQKKPDPKPGVKAPAHSRETMPLEEKIAYTLKSVNLTFGSTYPTGGHQPPFAPSVYVPALDKLKDPATATRLLLQAESLLKDRLKHYDSIEKEGDFNSSAYQLSQEDTPRVEDELKTVRKILEELKKAQ